MMESDRFTFASDCFINAIDRFVIRSDCFVNGRILFPITRDRGVIGSESNRFD